MISMSDHFTPDLTRVTSEVVDDEAIIVDLTIGVYYTMDAVAAAIWSMIEQRRSVAEMVELIGQRYIVSSDRAQDDLVRVLESLLRDRLIVQTGEDSYTPSEPFPNERLPYSTPEVQNYSDLSDLLALDLPVPAVSRWTELDPVLR